MHVQCHTTLSEGGVLDSEALHMLNGARGMRSPTAARGSDVADTWAACLAALPWLKVEHKVCQQWVKAW